jgi:hypothetical protein
MFSPPTATISIRLRNILPRNLENPLRFLYHATAVPRSVTRLIKTLRIAVSNRAARTGRLIAFARFRRNLPGSVSLDISFKFYYINYKC